MEITTGLSLLIFGLAFVCELIDSSLGMGYGTILSPVLIIMGFDPVVAVPAILLSQAFGGFTASIFHHKFKNASFTRSSKDLKVVFIISSLGVLATILAACVALHISRTFLKTYIGVLVFVMGVVLLSNRTFLFSWKKMVVLGLVSAFNKVVSGGGFGPVVTAGQIIAGQERKGAIASTTLSEVPICITGFLAYLVSRAVTQMDEAVLDIKLSDLFGAMFSMRTFQWDLALVLLIGSVCAAPFGAFVTKTMKTKTLSPLIGIVAMLLSILTIWKTFF